MKKYLASIVLAVASFACHAKGEPAPNPRPAVEEPPCHVPVKIRKEPTRVVLIDCDGNETAITNAELMGPQGKPGNDGHDGSPGRPGTNAADEVIKWCRHSPTDHINRTVNVKITDVVKQFGGYNGQADYPGPCGETEGRCACDAPICRNPNPQIHHYMTDGAD